MLGGQCSIWPARDLAGPAGAIHYPRLVPPVGCGGSGERSCQCNPDRGAWAQRLRRCGGDLVTLGR